MQRKSSYKIIELIKKTLQEYPNSSIRFIARKIKSEWITVANALTIMEELGLVKQISSGKNKREGRTFDLKK